MAACGRAQSPFFQTAGRLDSSVQTCQEQRLQRVTLETSPLPAQGSVNTPLAVLEEGGEAGLGSSPVCNSVILNMVFADIFNRC